MGRDFCSSKSGSNVMNAMKVCESPDTSLRYARDLQQTTSKITGLGAVIRQASVPALANVQSAEAVCAEMKRRAVMGN